MKMWIVDDRDDYPEQVYLRSLPVCYGEDLISPPSFYILICSILLETLSSRFANPNESSNMDLPLTLHELVVRLSWRSSTSVGTRGMYGWSRGLLISSLNMLVRHCHGPRWPFSLSCTVVKTHLEPSRSSCQSYHRESDQRHNHNMLGNSETTERNGNNMPRRRASAKESSQFKARNSIPCEDSETSSNKRKSQEQETHIEEQPTETQNSNPKRRALNRASGYSYSLNPIIRTIEDNNMVYIPNLITGHDVVDSTHMGVQPSLESISTQPLNSFSSIENTKLLFNHLIASPLEDLTVPENETSMKKALSILADNLSLFPEEQAKQIVELLFDFPALVHSWREYSRCQMYSQKSSAETEKIRDLLKTSVKDEESLKVRYEELKIKEKELMTQLAAVQKEKAGIAKQRTEKSKQIKDLISSAEEKAAHRNKEECLMKIATTKLNNLSDQWAKLQSFFI
ncbi:hypothetical protein AABB24_036364 [Solanum stoloniferum]|uniref:Uncharacterized protein n=1 Tax=Solanum stoloniferum TaxID=62892 RepID=A0ABD2REA1_9SOLN